MKHLNLIWICLALTSCATSPCQKEVKAEWWVFSDSEVTDLSDQPLCHRVFNGWICEDNDCSPLVKKNGKCEE